MGFFAKVFGSAFEPEAQPPRYDEDLPGVEECFDRLAAWTTGKRMADADPQYSSMIRSLPPGEATSMRLSRSPGTISLEGDDPRVFGYPGSIELNMPTLTELAGTPRILLDLGYAGIEHEATGILHDLVNRTYRLRMSSIASRRYPLLRLQISFYSNLREPLHLEVLSDMLDCNVQDFYASLCDSGRYELSVHVMRDYIGSVFSSVPGDEIQSLHAGIVGLTRDLEALAPESRDMQQAVAEFERRHPLGEGMRSALFTTNHLK